MKTTLDTTTGYLYFIDKSNPMATGNAGRVLLHRYLYSIYYGIVLDSTMHVHHKDSDKLNNSINNLKLLTASEHAKLHRLDQGASLLVDIVCPTCNKEFKQKASYSKYCSIKCKNQANIKDESISKDLLNSLIPTTSWVALGKMFGYSDVGIKKRAKALGCKLTRA